MNESISWVFEVSINDGELENFKALMKEMVEATAENEPGTLAYEWFISEDKKRCHICEWYRDSAATVAHLTVFKANYAARLMSLSEATRFVVYGNPDAAVLEALDGFGADYMLTLGGFVR